MKIRTGFVSNSSSSSFLVFFLKKPRTKAELMSIMFGNDVDGSISPYAGYTMSHADIVSRVFEDLTSQKRSLTKAQILREIRSGYFDGHPDYNLKGHRADDIMRAFYDEHPHMRIEDFPVFAKKQAAATKKERQLEDAFKKKYPGQSIHYTKDKVWKRKYDKARDASYNVYRDFVNKHPNPNINDFPEWHKKWEEAWTIDCQEYDQLIDVAAKKYFNKFVPLLKSRKCYIFSYADDGGQAVLEHGDIFNNLPYARISHH